MICEATFLKNKGNNKCFNNCGYSEVFCKKGVLTVHKIYSKKPVPVACNFIKKETVTGV